MFTSSIVSELLSTLNFPRRSLDSLSMHLTSRNLSRHRFFRTIRFKDGYTFFFFSFFAAYTIVLRNSDPLEPRPQLKLNTKQFLSAEDRSRESDEQSNATERQKRQRAASNKKGKQRERPVAALPPTPKHNIDRVPQTHLVLSRR